ncbi:hypothetical protein [Chryseotalea sanaruensis]|uniref:hypothetical protein n=1 Tax=Chryseotalea sanaruensis TaxID=2482724 RepID=UPI000F8F2826|nr:hypothetical protein [Chryseotalea sanaruensis]
MNMVLHLLIRSLATPFYKSHAGIFFFVFFIMFGVVESSQVVYYHQSLIYGVLTSTIFLLVVLALWLLYQVKVLLFFLKLLNQNDYQILNELALLSKTKNFLYFFILCSLTFLPVFLYSIAIFSIALVNGFYWQCLTIFSFQICLLAITAYSLTSFFHRKHIPPFIKLPVFSFTFLKGLSGIYWNYLLHKEKMAIALSKFFSIALIYVVKETLVEGDDFRIIALAWLFAVLSHTFIAIKLKSYEDLKLTWTRNLPISRFRTYSSYFLLYTILFIPEVILLVGTLGRGINLFQLPLLALLSSCFLLCFHTYLYKSNRNPDYLIHFIMVLFIFCFMMVLSKLIVPLAVCLVSISFFSFHHYYYRYQPKIE